MIHSAPGFRGMCRRCVVLCYVMEGGRVLRRSSFFHEIRGETRCLSVEIGGGCRRVREKRPPGILNGGVLLPSGGQGPNPDQGDGGGLLCSLVNPAQKKPSAGRKTGGLPRIQCRGVFYFLVRRYLICTQNEKRTRAVIGHGFRALLAAALISLHTSPRASHVPWGFIDGHKAGGRFFA